MDKALIGKGGIDAYIHAQYTSHKLNTEVKTVKEGEVCYWYTEFLVSYINIAKFLDTLPNTFDVQQSGDEGHGQGLG